MFVKTKYPRSVAVRALMRGFYKECEKYEISNNRQ